MFNMRRKSWWTMAGGASAKAIHRDMHPVQGGKAGVRSQQLELDIARLTPSLRYAVPEAIAVEAWGKLRAARERNSA